MKKIGNFKKVYLFCIFLLQFLSACKTELEKTKSINKLTKSNSSVSLMPKNSTNNIGTIIFKARNGILKVDSLSQLYQLMEHLVNLNYWRPRTFF
jgi:hypothetical protein